MKPGKAYAISPAGMSELLSDCEKELKKERTKRKKAERKVKALQKELDGHKELMAKAGLPGLPISLLEFYELLQEHGE